MVVKKRSGTTFFVLIPVFVIAMGTVIAITQYKTDEIVDRLAHERTLSAKEGLISYFHDLARRAQQRAELIATRDYFIEALKNDDRETLKKTLQDYSYSMDFVSVCDHKGIVLTRSYSDMHGDDATVHPTVRAIIYGDVESLSPFTVLPHSEFVVGASVPVYTAPIEEGGTLIGIVNCIFDLTKSEYLDVFKRRTGCEASIIIGTERIATTLMDDSGDRLVGSSPHASALDAIYVQGKEQHTGLTTFFGQTHNAHYSPLEHNDEVIGILTTFVNIQHAIDAQRSLNFWLLLAAVTSLIVLAGLVWVGRRHYHMTQELSTTTVLLDDRENLLSTIDTQIVITEAESDRIVFANEKQKQELGLTSSIIGQYCWQVLTKGATGRCSFCPKHTLDINSDETLTWEFYSPVSNRHYRIRCRFIDWPDGSRVLLEQGDDITDVIESVALAREAEKRAALLETTKRIADYELLKHDLTIKAMNVAMWETEAISGLLPQDKEPFFHEIPLIYSMEFRTLLGYTDEKDFPNVISTWTNSIHPDDRERVINEILAHLNDRSGKTPYDSEYRVKAKDGTYRYFEAYGTTLRDEAGLPLRMVGAVKDITEEKRMSEELEAARSDLEKSLEMMTSILNKSGALILVMEPTTDEILFASDALKELLKLERDVRGEFCYKAFRGKDARCDFCPGYQLDKEPDKIVYWEEQLPYGYFIHRNCYANWPGGKKAHVQIAFNATDIKKNAGNITGT